MLPRRLRRSLWPGSCVTVRIVYNETTDITYVACLIAGRGSGTTAEQSIKLSLSWPITESLAITSLKASDIFSCSLMKPCHVQAVRGSRAMRKSDWRRISPTLRPDPKGRGERASPTHSSEIQ